MSSYEVFIKLFPVDVTLKIIAISLAYLATWMSPFLIPLVVALRRRKVMHKRRLFVFIVGTLLYGFALVFVFAVLLPIEAFLTFIFPTLQANELPRPGWLASLFDFLRQYGQLFVWPPIVLAMSATLTWYLTPRWNRIADALSTRTKP